MKAYDLTCQYLKKALVIVVVLLSSSIAWSANLADVVTDLYGGNGIALSVASGPFHLPHFTADSVAALENLNDLEIIGIYPDYATAHKAWQGAAFRTADNANIRYFIVHLHKLLNPES